MISLFVVFVCEDSKQLVSNLCGAVFQFYAELSPEDADDTDVSKLCGSPPCQNAMFFVDKPQFWAKNFSKKVPVATSFYDI